MSGVKSGETWFIEALTTLLERRDLGADAMRQLTERFVSGECGEVEMASLLVALRMKGGMPIPSSERNVFDRMKTRTLSSFSLASSSTN